MNKKGFTLIELLAVLVVLAIIALITIPIVLGIINRARIKSAEASIRGYADTLEKAYSQWLIDNPNGTFNDFNYSNIEYKGNRVTCDDVNYSNGNIELECCSVGNSTNNYYSYKNSSVTHYNVCPSRKEYQIGDTFTLNGDSYHVIANSPTTQDYVVALKDNPLTVSEINTYGKDADGINYINVNTYDSRNTSYIYPNNIGGMAYYSSSTCHDRFTNSSPVTEGCITDYKDSHIKHAVDNWTSDKYTHGELKEINGYKSRLIKLNELEGLGYTSNCDNYDGLSCPYSVNPNVPMWVYSNNYPYWTMTHDINNYVYGIDDYGNIGSRIPSNYNGNVWGAVRPVINVYKKYIN